MKKATLLTACSWTPGFPKFERSLTPLAMDVQRVICTFNPQITQEKMNTNIDTLHCVFEMPYNNIQRFVAIRKILPYLDKKGWFIFTDTDDVRCQTALPDLTHVPADIIVSPERSTFGETDFYNGKPEFDHLKDQEIYNCGTFAMKYDALKEFLDFFYSQATKVYHSFVDDMLHFNDFVGDQKKVERSDLFMCLYNNIKTVNCMQDPDGIWNNEDGEPICFIHANGNTKKDIGLDEVKMIEL